MLARVWRVALPNAARPCIPKSWWYVFWLYRVIYRRDAASSHAPPWDAAAQSLPARRRLKELASQGTAARSAPRSGGLDARAEAWEPQRGFVLFYLI